MRSAAKKLAVKNRRARLRGNVGQLSGDARGRVDDSGLLKLLPRIARRVAIGVGQHIGEYGGATS